MVARMLCRSLSWMGWWEVGLPTDAGTTGFWAAAVNDPEEALMNHGARFSTVPPTDYLIGFSKLLLKTYRFHKLCYVY